MLRIRPGQAVAHNGLGKALRAQGLDEQASHHFLRAIESGLESTQTHYDLANLLRQSGDLPGAIQHYRRTLEIDPDHGGAKRALESLRGRVP
jgi:tetratricopeptide (TPR) repeat protein